MNDKKSLFWFVQPTLIALAAYGIICGAVWLARARNTPSAGQLQSTLEQIESAVDDLVLPAPSMEPAEVVRIQLAALSNPDRAAGAVQCHAFASPANRAITGSLEQFAAMLKNEPYDALLSPDGVLVGEPKPIDDVIRVFVSLVSGEQFHSFVWVLSRQTDEHYRDCWMTDAVFPLPPPPKLTEPPAVTAG